jgi:hypothetical protein
VSSHAQVQAHARGAAAHPFWLFQEDIRLSGQVWRIWRGDVPGGEWLATTHDADPNEGAAVKARGATRDHLLPALLASLKSPQ